MAESNQRKIADPIDLDDEDPFAELTRIMGFDPRALSQPRDLVGANNAKPGLVTAKADQPSITHAYDDFGIDLEKELLGGFDDFDLPHEPARDPSAGRATPAEAIDAQLDRDLAEAIEFEPMEAEPTAATQSVVSDDGLDQIATVADPAVVATPAEAIDAQFDHDLAEAIEFEPMEAELGAAMQSVVSDDGLKQVAAVAGPVGAATPAKAIESESTGAELTAAAQSIFGDDLFEDDVAEDIRSSAPPSVASAPVAEEDSLDDALATELDLHFAEPEPKVAASPDAELIDWRVIPETVADEHGAAAPRGRNDGGIALGVASRENAAAPDDDDLMPEFDLGDLDLHHDSHDVEPAQAELAHEERVSAALVEASLADKAQEVRPGDGFADVDMDFSAVFEREFDDGDDDQAAPATAVEQAAAEPDKRLAAAANSDDHLELSLEHGTSALLKGDHVQSPPLPPAAIAPVAAAPVAAAPQRGRSQFLSDPRWSALEADEGGEPVDRSSQFSRAAASAARAGATAAEERRPFGDRSLTSRHANFPLPQAPVAPPEEDLDDLLASMESEVHAADQVPRPVVEQEQPNYAASSAASALHPDDHGDVPPRLADDEDRAPAQPAHVAAPDIETIDVPEAAVALADDLDLPELAYEEDERQPAAYDDIDADFAASFNQIATNEEPVSQAVRGTARPAERANLDADYEALYRPAYAQARQPQPAEEIDFEPLVAEDGQDRQPQDYDDYAPAAQPVTAGDRFVDLDFDGDVDEEALPSIAEYQQPQRSRRGRAILIGAIVVGIALLGGASVLAMSYVGGGKPEAPVLVKADDGPVKVKPENPGGTAVPNQDNKVYDAVKGTAAQATPPAQKTLVTTAEEPVDMAAVDKADALPGVNDDQPIIPKAEDRVDPVADADQDPPAQEDIAVAPRKVKTMMVRSDGTLVPREEPAVAAPADTAAVAAAADQVPAPSTNDETGAVSSVADDGPAFQSPGGDVVPVKPVKSTKVNGEGKTPAASLPPKAVKSTKVDANGKAAVAAEAPALAPANIVDDAAAEPAAEPATAPQPVAEKPAEAKPVKPEEVASANVEPTVIAAGAWSVQIASQPSAEAAKSSYEDLAKRFGSVIGGRGVNIVKAEIDGKGTYWRVRVPAKSRNDAISLCTDYKAAGGNCFVSK